MIQTPASGPLSPITWPPMSCAEISTVAANAALPCSRASSPAPAVQCLSFMFLVPYITRVVPLYRCVRACCHARFVMFQILFNASLLSSRLLNGCPSRQPPTSHMVKSERSAHVATCSSVLICAISLSVLSAPSTGAIRSRALALTASLLGRESLLERGAEGQAGAEIASRIAAAALNPCSGRCDLRGTGFEGRCGFAST